MTAIKHIMTIDQVKADIRSGKCKRIYVGVQSLWWTHLESDMHEATKDGIKFKQRVNEKLLNDPNIPADEKYILIRSNADLEAQYVKDPQLLLKHTIPTDPIGHIITEDNFPERFITQSVMNPYFFGKHGLKAFMQAHHQNTKDFFSNKWKAYNDYMDKRYGS